MTDDRSRVMMMVANVTSEMDLPTNDLAARCNPHSNDCDRPSKVPDTSKVVNNSSSEISPATGSGGENLAASSNDSKTQPAAEQAEVQKREENLQDPVFAEQEDSGQQLLPALTSNHSDSSAIEDYKQLIQSHDQHHFNPTTSQDENQLDRRISLLNRHKLTGSSLAKELRKLRDNQKVKQIFGANGRRNNKNSKQKGNANKIKSRLPQTRQEAATQVHQQPLAENQQQSRLKLQTNYLSPSTQALSSVNSLTNVIRQHFPNLQLYSTVQKMIMGKMGSSSPSSGDFSTNQQHLQHQLANSMFLQHQDPRLHSDLPSQWATAASDETPPTYMTAALSSAPKPPAKVIPVEIIGLDPSVSGSILYGDSGGGIIEESGAVETEPPVANSNRVYGTGMLSGGEDTSSTGIISTPIRLLPEHPPALPLMRPGGYRPAPSNSSSVLHIHHFHHTQNLNQPINSAALPGSQSSGGSHMDSQQTELLSGQQQTSGEPELSPEANKPHQLTSVSEGTKFYTNERGELIYVTADGQMVQTGQQAPRELDSSQQTNGSPESEQQMSPQQDQPQQSPDYLNTVPINPNAPTEDTASEGQHASSERQVRPQYRWKHRIPSSTKAGSTQEQAVDNGASSKQLLMVAYRPQLDQSGAMVAGEPTRNYGEGQESKAISINNKLKLAGQVSPMQEAIASPPMKQVSSMTTVSGSGLGNITPPTEYYKQAYLPNIKMMDPSNPNYPTTNPKQQQAQGRLNRLRLQEQQVPFNLTLPLKVQTVPLLLDGGPGNAASSSSELSGNRLEFGKHTGGGAKPTLSSMIKNNAHKMAQHQQLIENLALIRQLNQMSSELQRQQQVAASKVPLVAGHSLANATRLSNNELVSLLHELKSSNHGRNGTLTGHYQQVADGEHRGLFEMTSASDNPMRFMKNGPQLQQHFAYQKPLNGSFSKQSNVPGDTYTSPSKSSPNLQKMHQISNSTDDSNSNDSSHSISHLALAFIFAVSMLTITIIAVSMIYRYRRRSSAGCSRLPGRSRLNLTQRTKHFMRSNFVRATDVTSIKSFNTNRGPLGDSTTASVKQSATPTGPNHVKSVSKRLEGAAAPANPGNRQRQLFGGHPPPSMSTFNGTSPSLSSHSARYHFSELDNQADIRTLNTRLNKQAAPRSPMEKQVASAGKLQSRNHRQINEANSACYLNLKHGPPPPTANKCSAGRDAMHSADLKQVNRL